MAALTFTGAASKPAPRPSQLALIGTYTNNTRSQGIYAAEFDPDSGKLKLKGLAAATPDPSWIVIHPNGRFVYAANESGKQSMVTAFTLDTKNAKLTQLNQLPALGEDPCYLSFDKAGKFLFVANYTSGNVVVFPIQPDGSLGPHTALVKDAGSLGPNKARQEGPHAHWIGVSPDNHFVFVSDLGLDAVLSYRFDAVKGTLTPNHPPMAQLASGSGPRHLAFAPNGKYVYVISELNATITAFSYDPSQGSLFEMQIVSTLANLVAGSRNDAAEISVSPDGNNLYVSNRGPDTISAFAVSSTDGSLTHTGDYPTEKEPRHFTIDPSGRFLLAENQNSNSVTAFRIDPASGALSRGSQVGDIPSPVCLAFLPNL
ncbi:MAG TPA: lactonase family protein [Candidatus Acidoferrum sp.]|nr:lactonase family protein [Candidatus Acidoferrum sp.]